MRHPTLSRGFAALPVILLLLFALALAIGVAQQRHLDELRSATRQHDAAQAFASAEAGLAWAVAMLNEPRPLDAHCVATAGAATSFRDRHLVIAPATGAVTTLSHPAACARIADAWRCRCPAGDAAVPAIEAPGMSTAFEVRFADADAPGLVRLVATGCRRLPCADPAEAPEAVRRLELTLGLLPALANPPAAALTVRGDLDAGTAPIGLHNGDASSGGIAVLAGGRVRAPDARTSGVAGAPAATIVDDDASLRATPPQRLFASLFGLDPALWQRQPGVAHVACTGTCNGVLAEALATHRLAFVEGDLALDGPIALGTPERPVVVVAQGAIRLRGAVALHGLLHGADIGWNDAGDGALVRGALVSEGSYAGNASPGIVHDAALLAALRAAGSFAPLPGGWKDFR